MKFLRRKSIFCNLRADELFRQIKLLMPPTFDGKAESNGVRQKLWGNISNLIAAAVLVVSFSVSLWRVYKVQEVETESGVSTIRVVHWQLEAGFREALDEIARSFERVYLEETGFRVRVIQNAISERVYKQYVQTQAIGKTLPDLVELVAKKLVRSHGSS